VWGITTQIDEARVEQRQMNQPDKDRVERHLVCDRLAAGARAHPRGASLVELTNVIM
jgi:hypothetical protein